MAKVLLVVDMLNDFARKGGALYSPRIETLIPGIKDVCKMFENRGDRIIFLCDAHDKNDKEFEKFPPHAIKSTEGAEIVAELREYAISNECIVEKKRYSGFFRTVLYGRLMHCSEEGNEVVVVGCCTDICILYTVQGLANRDILTTVIRNCVDTYDVDDETAKRFGVPSHHADKLNEVFFAHMKNILGAKIVDEYLR